MTPLPCAWRGLWRAALCLCLLCWQTLGFAAGSMGPKVQAACDFARNTGKVAVISSLENIEGIVKGKAGTRVSTEKPGISYR